MGFLTTAVGSFPKPRFLRRARLRFRDEEIDVRELRREEDRALDEVLALQERLGLSIVTDGEMTREDLVAHYAGRIEGLEPGQLVRCWGNRYVRRPRVTAPLERRESILAPAWKAAQERTARPLRAIVTGPYTLMHWSFDEHYPTRRDCARAFGAAVAAEVAELADAGAAEIQLDEPALGAAREETAWATELIAEVAARRGAARLWAHVGFGDPAPDWAALARLPVDCLMVGLAHLGLEDDPGLAALPAATTLAAGVLDSIDPADEPGERIRTRIRRVLRRVPGERLILTPDTGLRNLTPEQAERKLRALAAAAS